MEINCSMADPSAATTTVTAKNSSSSNSNNNNNNIQFIKLLCVIRNIIAIHHNKNTVNPNPTITRIIRITKEIHVYHMTKTMNNLDAMLRKVADSKFVSGLATL